MTTATTNNVQQVCSFVVEIRPCREHGVFGGQLLRSPLVFLSARYEDMKFECG
jgi:hypothetical protein